MDNWNEGINNLKSLGCDTSFYDSCRIYTTSKRGRSMAQFNKVNI
jgi:hypothetical protein